MSKRPPAAPPQLPGFEYIRLLGSGGFADVFLYEQQMPKRRVAVKVLLPDRLESAGQQFASEANVMAMLSNHPAIVTILQAGMSADQRPYIVMEHCPRPNLQLRYRRASFSVSESLHTAVPVIAAVETAHRMGVLHRDIKPANILVTEYNRPALTDFGIAAHAETAEAAAGMSIPWSPPESFDNPPRNGPTTDVYQLGATVYTLLAGRAPFEVPGQRNSSAELIDRAERMPLMRLERPDVPVSLQNVLARAMAKRPEDRYQTAVALARALQKVQIELEHSVTPIDILDDSPTEEFDDDNDGLTRVRNVTNIVPDPHGANVTTQRAGRSVDDATVARAGNVDEATTIRGRGRIDDATTVVPPRKAQPAPPAEEQVHESAATLPPPARVDHGAAGAAGAPAPLWGGGSLGGPGRGAGGHGGAFLGGGSGSDAPRHSEAGVPGVGSGAAGDGAGWGTARPESAAAGSMPVDGASGSRRPTWPWYAGGGVVVVGLLIGAAFALPALTDGEPEPVSDPTTQPQEPVTDTPPAVADLTAEVSGDEVTFSWTNQEPQEGDTYQWGLDEVGAETDFQDTRDTSVTVPSTDPTCIEVYLVRADGVASPAATTCAN